MVYNALKIFLLILFCLPAFGKQSFQLADFYELDLVQTKRYLGALEQLALELESVEQKKAKKYKSPRSRYKELFKNASFWQYLIFVAEANSAAEKAICFNNGVIREVHSCQKSSSNPKERNWGFDMSSYRGLFEKAGLKVRCDGSNGGGDIPLQSCGIFGLRSDLTIACSRNSTKSCLGEESNDPKDKFDRSAAVKIIRGCLSEQKKIQSGNFKDFQNSLKTDVEISLQTDTKEQKRIKCQPIMSHLEEQMSLMTQHCREQGKVSRSVRRICQKARCLADEIIMSKEENALSLSEAIAPRNFLVVAGEKLSSEKEQKSFLGCMKKQKLHARIIKNAKLSSDELHREIWSKSEKIKESPDMVVLAPGNELLKDFVAEQEKFTKNKSGKQDKAFISLREAYKKKIQSIRDSGRGCVLVIPETEDVKLLNDLKRLVIEPANRNPKLRRSQCSVVSGNDLKKSGGEGLCQEMAFRFQPRSPEYCPSRSAKKEDRLSNQKSTQESR